MFPSTLALVDDDRDFLEFLCSFLTRLGTAVATFPDSIDLVTHAQPYGFDFYIVDLTLPGIGGAELIRLLRRRTDAGVLVVSGKLEQHAVEEAMDAGADMYLIKPVRFEQIELAIRAILRRARRDAVKQPQWRLNRTSRTLAAPDGGVVELSVADLAVLDCFVEARGAPVSRETLLARLGRSAEPGETDSLNATIFRLRRRIERVTPLPQPLQAKSRVGYVFRDALLVA